MGINETVSEVLIYEAAPGVPAVAVRLEGETLWLSQVQIAELFGRERSVVTKHLRNVFKEGELDEKSNVQNLHIAGSDKPVRFYNLDVIIPVGYRVNSKRGTQFRQWASQVLKAHLVQGFTLNQARLADRGLTEAQQSLDLLRELEITKIPFFVITSVARRSNFTKQRHRLPRFARNDSAGTFAFSVSHIDCREQPLKQRFDDPAGGESARNGGMRR